MWLPRPRPSPRCNQPKTPLATAAPTTDLDDEGLGICDLHSPSFQTRLELLPREPQGHYHWLKWCCDVEVVVLEWECCGKVREDDGVADETGLGVMCAQADETRGE
ncbi:hypothetical protein DEO72_LG2g2888 [Vigna unguiculata]|uniref:Uncharacterized protein n=1 Tax=Vigna unguiculata TaxID=3917 RepID=A0A4D6L243_VIGUN|nr:hypothetical protein DEO72_LG2g2888 [Vigna unguiculata]